MKKAAFLKSFVIMSIVVSFAILSQVSAEEVAKKKDITGDWLLKADFNGRPMESILSLVRDADGKLGGKWISFWGYSEINDAKFEDGKLSFSRTMMSAFAATARYSVFVTPSEPMRMKPAR